MTRLPPASSLQYRASVREPECRALASTPTRTTGPGSVSERIRATVDARGHVHGAWILGVGGDGALQVGEGAGFQVNAPDVVDDLVQGAAPRVSVRCLGQDPAKRRSWPSARAASVRFLVHGPCGRRPYAVCGGFLIRGGNLATKAAGWLPTASVMPPGEEPHTVEL